MAGEETTNTNNIRQNYDAAQLGLNMDQTLGQIKKGTLTYALNANLENFDSNSVNYQNEEGNVLCSDEENIFFPNDFVLIGTHFINEQNKHIFFLVNPVTGASEIGYMVNNNCQYLTIVGASQNDCLNFNINYPIHKVVHKITNCTTEIYWTDGLNPRRWMNIDSVPWKTHLDPLDNCTYINDEPLMLDCNKIKIQPNFDIPQINIDSIVTGGELIAGTYQFAIQYCDALGFGYTSYYSVTNPVPIAKSNAETLEFNYPVNKSIVVNISNIDVTGEYKYYNLAVIKTINSIASVELIGTYYIDSPTNQITYTGQNQTQIRLAIEDIFEKFPYYDVAQDVTAVQDILVWDQLTTADRINYQTIAAQITLNWETYTLPKEKNYSDSFYAAKLRGYLRDEVYAFEICFLLRNGRQTDGFHIPGRTFITGVDGGTPETTISSTNADYIGTGSSSPKWKIYNTASVTGNATETNPIGDAIPYKYGQFSYWQSLEEYPCNEVFTEAGLTGPIRHHKFPDVLVSPIFESATPVNVGGQYQVTMQTACAVYPIGVRLSVSQIESLIAASSLTAEQKAEIVGFKILRGNRSTNQSIVGKGILRNVGKYTREGTDYYFPNYPYNDLNKDPFILEKNNAYNQQCQVFGVNVTTAGTIQITSCYTGATEVLTKAVGYYRICSLTSPIALPGGGSVITVSTVNPDFYTRQIPFIISSKEGTAFQYVTNGNLPFVFLNLVVEPNTTVLVNAWATPAYFAGSKNYSITSDPTLCIECYPEKLNAFSTDASKYRQVFNSPETSFGQPTLGSVLKLENVMFGAGTGHFVQVRNNATYKLVTKEAQYEALLSSYHFGNSVSPFDAVAMFTTYQSYLTIYISAIVRKNFSWSYNSIGQYDYSDVIGNSGFKQREISNTQYLGSGFQSVADDNDLNNFQRESSVYVKTASSKTPLPFPNNVPAISGKISDLSRITASTQLNCGTPENQVDLKVVAYYASMKNIVPNQWGQLYTYQTIDTGFQVDISTYTGSNITTVFGGDTFISRFAFKTKLPFYIDNRVSAPDDSDVFYEELGNVAYPQYWHSSRSILYNFNKPDAGSAIDQLTGIISIKAHILDCGGTVSWVDPYATTTTTTTVLGGTSSTRYQLGYDGKMYQFAYGIPYFYCESSINVDLRQAFNDREGDYYPRVSSGIPDDWFQQVRVPIALDNTYYYNTTFSKQNTENNFTHLPFNWDDNQCNVVYPFRATYSEPQSSDPTVKINNWLIYRPISYFDFPQNYGDLVSLDGIQNKAILARFENKSLLYNTMLTINTSNPQAAYIGNPSLFRSSPPIDFAETDLGYVGSQNKMLLKIPQGQITVDAKRGQIFLITGNGAQDLTAFGSGVNRFMTDHLAFEILRYFPNADTDNNFTKVGIHGVFDSKYDRIIISKLDYVPQVDWIGSIYYDNDPTSANYKEYYILVDEAPVVVQLLDPIYFCNRSWTLSFNMNTKTWVSFHSYIPNYYIAENNFFYSGLNQGCDLDFVAAIEVPDCVLAGTAVGEGCSISGTASFV
jgi:hypothetical protein